MDGESSYESDISESWSLIDINLNEESISVAEAYSELEKSSQSDLKVEKLNVENETELEDFVRQCKETNRTDFNRLSDSDSDASSKDHGLPECSDRTEANEIDSPLKRSSDNDALNDSGDTESIEILDMDCYHDSETDRHDIPTIDRLGFPEYHSDDDESSEGKFEIENRTGSSTVIKRRRKRGNRSSEDTVHTVNSENISSAGSNSTSSSSDTKKESSKFIDETKGKDGHPVYKHYRNNVANTILSLSVGVIFAGVACIAVGHFLGVQDAAETAVELVETLKKLQVENAALQSRLSHLNRALLNREMNYKLELPLNQPNKAANEPTSCIDHTKSKQTDLNNAALSEIRSSLNSIEYLSKLQNFVKKNNKVTDTENGFDFNRFGKFIHDQLHTLNVKQEEGAKLLEYTDRKISKVLHKIINKLSSSQDHIEKLYERLIKLKNKLNHKINKIFSESSRHVQSEKSKPKRRVPVTEFDLQSMNWKEDYEIHQPSARVNPEGVVLYKFPQPESYYEKENDLKATKEFERINATANLEKGENHKKKKWENDKKEEKKISKDKWKKKKCKEKENKTEKKRKRAAEKMQKSVKYPENGVKKIKLDETGNKKLRVSQNVFIQNQTIFQSKMHPKMGEKNVLTKLKFKKMKSSNPKKVLLSKLKNKPYLKTKNYPQMGPGHDSFNVTGHWIFKLAGGREEIRQRETKGDWQFERAKARRVLRYDDQENWQFERAKARKELRYDEQENWQFKRASARENNRNDFRWYRGKYAKYAGKDFFHEGFSWI